MRLWQRVLGTVAVVAAAGVLAPAAMASATASISLNQSAGTSAGASHNLGLNLSFTNSGTDSPKNLTLNLPPGLLANAAADGGACLKSAITSGTACEVGSGTVSAETDPLGIINLPVQVPQTVDFYLVPPPKAGDLAGLAVEDPSLGEQLGSTGDVTIRPSGSSLGVGATIALTLPDELPLAGINLTQISVESIDATFDSLRYPATCPSSPAPLTATVDSYQDASPQTLSAPLTVTGCSSLTYNPQFSATAAKDSSDDGVALTTTVTQGASEAPNRSVALTFPTSVFSPDLHALHNLCLKSVSSCTPVGSVTAASPLYPTPLTGQAYFTGNSSGPGLTLTFPAPFPLTLVGTVSTTTDTAAFSGLPDIPLTQLAVKLNGGSQALFATGCNPPSGTATARLVDQNGDQTRSVPSKLSVSGCPGVKSGSGGSGGSGSGGSGSGGSGSGGSSSTTSSGPSASIGGTHLAIRSVSGLASGKPSLRFTVSVTKHAAKFTRMTVTLPAGLSLRSHKVHRRTVIRGVSVKGAKVRSLALSHHHLVITLRRSARSARVTLGPRSLRESRAMRAQAERKKLKRLRLKVAVRDTRHRTRTLTVTVRKLHL